MTNSKSGNGSTPYSVRISDKLMRKYRQIEEPALSLSEIMELGLSSFLGIQTDMELFAKQYLKQAEHSRMVIFEANQHTETEKYKKSVEKTPLRIKIDERIEEIYLSKDKFNDENHKQPNGSIAFHDEYLQTTKDRLLGLVRKYINEHKSEGIIINMDDESHYIDIALKAKRIELNIV